MSLLRRPRALVLLALAIAVPAWMAGDEEGATGFVDPSDPSVLDPDVAGLLASGLHDFAALGSGIPDPAPIAMLGVVLPVLGCSRCRRVG